MVEIITALNGTPVDRLLFYGLVLVLCCHGISFKIINNYITKEDGRDKH